VDRKGKKGLIPSTTNPQSFKADFGLASGYCIRCVDGMVLVVGGVRFCDDSVRMGMGFGGSRGDDGDGVPLRAAQGTGLPPSSAAGRQGPECFRIRAFLKEPMFNSNYSLYYGCLFLARGFLGMGDPSSHH